MIKLYVIVYLYFYDSAEKKLRLPEFYYLLLEIRQRITQRTRAIAALELNYSQLITSPLSGSLQNKLIIEALLVIEYLQKNLIPRLSTTQKTSRNDKIPNMLVLVIIFKAKNIRLIIKDIYQPRLTILISNTNHIFTKGVSLITCII